MLNIEEALPTLKCLSGLQVKGKNHRKRPEQWSDEEEQ